MRATLAGLGAWAGLAAGGEGTVLASFPRACYARLPRGLVALVAPDVRPGPLYLALEGSPPRVEPGTPVVASGEAVRIGDVQIDTREARVWTGPLPSPGALSAGTRLAVEAAGRVASDSALVAAPFRERAGRARALLDGGRLEEAGELLSGLGPGLTPSGDDALGGVLFALRVALGAPIESRSIEVARSAETNELSRAFLTWAARGQALAPAHDLVWAAAAGGAADAASACRAMGEVGETSGADFLLGLTWGLQAVEGLRGAYREASTSS